MLHFCLVDRYIELVAANSIVVKGEFMCMLIVGGDTISPITEELALVGFDQILHWDGRRRSLSHKKIPQKVECVLMLTSYLNHPIMKKVKEDAKKRGIPSIFAKRNRIDVRDAMKCKECLWKNCKSINATK